MHHLKQFVRELVDDYQSHFVAERSNFDEVIIALEVIHH